MRRGAQVQERLSRRSILNQRYFQSDSGRSPQSKSRSLDNLLNTVSFTVTFLVTYGTTLVNEHLNAASCTIRRLRNGTNLTQTHNTEHLERFGFQFFFRSPFTRVSSCRWTKGQTILNTPDGEHRSATLEHGTQFTKFASDASEQCGSGFILNFKFCSFRLLTIRSWSRKWACPEVGSTRGTAPWRK